MYFVAVRLVGADDGHGGVGGDEDSRCEGDKERKTAAEDVGITLVVDEAVLREGVVHQREHHAIQQTGKKETLHYICINMER